MTIRKTPSCLLIVSPDAVFVSNPKHPVSVSGGRGGLQDVSLFSTPLLLGVESASIQPLSSDLTIVLAIIGILILIGIFALIRILRDGYNG